MGKLGYEANRQVHNITTTNIIPQLWYPSQTSLSWTILSEDPVDYHVRRCHGQSCQKIPWTIMSEDVMDNPIRRSLRLSCQKMSWTILSEDPLDYDVRRCHGQSHQKIYWTIMSEDVIILSEDAINHYFRLHSILHHSISVPYPCPVPYT